MKPTDPHPGHGASGRRTNDDGVPRHQSGVHDELHNDDVAHEHSDVNLGAIGMSVVVLSSVGAAAMLAMYLLFGWFERSAAANDPATSPLAARPTDMPNTTNASPAFNAGLTTAPQLLTNEPMALRQQRTAEQERLHSYGWVDQNAGVARMPIDAAKKLVAERGLPAREGAGSPEFSVRIPARGEASGGRVITVPLPERTDTAPAAAPAQQHGDPAKH
jgi:hypothetical protein